MLRQKPKKKFKKLKRQSQIMKRKRKNYNLPSMKCLTTTPVLIQINQNIFKKCIISYLIQVLEAILHSLMICKFQQTKQELLKCGKNPVQTTNHYCMMTLKYPLLNLLMEVCSIESQRFKKNMIKLYRFRTSLKIKKNFQLD